MKVAIGLGCSLGPRRRTLELAVRHLDRPDLRLLRVSRWYASPPLAGGSARNPFLNGVALFETHLPPPEILARCRALEAAAGRRRARHWGDRTLDLDVLQYGDRVSDDPALTLPHPAVGRRPFVLWPLLEVWPDATDPRTQRPWRASPPPDRPHPWPVGAAARPCQRPLLDVPDARDPLEAL